MTITITREKTTRTDVCTACGGEFELTRIGRFRPHGPRRARCPGSNTFARSALDDFARRRARRVALVLEIIRPHAAIATTLAPDIVDRLDALALEMARE